MKRILLSLLIALTVLPARAGDVKLAYAASSALTVTLASLATSADLLTGREATAVDNSSNKYLDFLLAGKVTTGSSPTTAKQILICVVALAEDAVWPDAFDGTDSAETITTVGIQNQICPAAAVIQTTGTSDVTYWFGPVSVASVFNGKVPLKFTVFVSHNTAVNLNSTAGNQAIYITPVYKTAALD